MIVFIPRFGDGCKPGGYDAEWLPRQCPACRQVAIVGGRRRRQAHDAMHDAIVVRRGICKVCGRTPTALPGWCVPGAPYNLPARQQALDRLGQGGPLEQAAPDCRDPDRIADPSTVRRWFSRRVASLRFLLWTPTLFAWDWFAASRILFAEPLSP